MECERRKENSKTECRKNREKDMQLKRGGGRERQKRKEKANEFDKIDDGRKVEKNKMRERERLGEYRYRK